MDSFRGIAHCPRTSRNITIWPASTISPRHNHQQQFGGADENSGDMPASTLTPTSTNESDSLSRLRDPWIVTAAMTRMTAANQKKKEKTKIILPGFFEQSHTRIWLKGLIRIWCNVVSRLLGIRSYLLGNERLTETEEAVPARLPLDNGQGLGAAHQAILERDVPVGFQPYDRPALFILRLVGLIFLMCCSLVVSSIFTLTIPVWIGRQCMTFWYVRGHVPAPEQSVVPSEVTARPHELYTAAIGTYLCWLISRGITVAVNLVPQGRQAIFHKLKQWLSIGASYALAALIFILMLGVIPLMFGLLLELVLVIPLRVPLEQTPVHFLWQDWTLGVLYTKIACALTVMGPDWRLKRAIERACHDGLRDIDLKFIIRELATPVITCFGLVLAIPYVIAHSILPIFLTNQYIRILVAREIYPFFLIMAIVIVIIYFQIRQFKKLYVAIKNDKYLVGQRLVNYDHRKKKSLSAIATTSQLTSLDCSVDAAQEPSVANEQTAEPDVSNAGIVGP